MRSTPHHTGKQREHRAEKERNLLRDGGALKGKRELCFLPFKHSARVCNTHREQTIRRVGRLQVTRLHTHKLYTNSSHDFCFFSFVKKPFFVIEILFQYKRTSKRKRFTIRLVFTTRAYIKGRKEGICHTRLHFPFKILFIFYHHGL